jgi:hypothetical protein
MGAYTVRASVGFEDSTLDPVSGKSFCYQGNADDVCGLLRGYAAEMQRRYAGGADDTIDLSTCDVADRKVTAAYHLSDVDGDAVDVTRIIERCIQN